MKAKLISRGNGNYKLYVDEIPYATTGNSPYNKLSKQTCDEIFGFNKAMKLNKDKVFTLEDVKRAMRMVFDWHEFDSHPECTSLNELLDKFQSIEIEVDVEVELNINGKNAIDRSRYIPKLDSEGCLILKKI
jgi:hypothetical protein